MEDRDRWVRNEVLLGGLDPPYSTRFEDVVKGLERWGWKPRVMETRRSFARQVWLVAKGASRTLRSKHLTGRAMDLIDSRYAWDSTPLEFIVDLMILAETNGLLTGGLFGLTFDEKVERRIQAKAGQAGELKALLRVRCGWDPCHVEVPGV